MTNLEFSLGLFGIAYFAGNVGALTGLGGGVILVPVITLFFGIDVRYAMGASLISVIATSSGAALTFLKENYTNLKIGMFLEIPALIGAVVGAILVTHLPVHWIGLIFGVILIISIGFSFKKLSEPDIKFYTVKRVPQGFCLMGLAGMLSGLLGIGSGAFKVLALDLCMGLPYKVSTSTSNFMIGMTASASVGIYFSAGYIDLFLVFPVLLGVLLGAYTGAKWLIVLHAKPLRLFFNVVIFLLALEMIYKAIR